MGNIKAIETIETIKAIKAIETIKAIKTIKTIKTIVIKQKIRRKLLRFAPDFYFKQSDF